MNEIFTKIAGAVAHGAGKPVTFALCCLLVIAWGVSGPFFGFSDTWQLVINTGTTIVTFLMVFLIQNTQNRDGAAVQAKLDEIIEFLGCDDAIVGAEHLTEEEIRDIRTRIEERSSAPNGGKRRPGDHARKARRASPAPRSRKRK